jgi:hypothetical protein
MMMAMTSNNDITCDVTILTHLAVLGDGDAAVAVLGLDGLPIKYSIRHSE